MTFCPLMTKNCSAQQNKGIRKISGRGKRQEIKKPVSSSSSSSTSVFVVSFVETGKSKKFSSVFVQVRSTRNKMLKGHLLFLGFV